MATLDFTALYRSTIGFDQLPLLFAHALEHDDAAYPPCNIEKIDDDAYRIELALSGFSADAIEIVVEQNRLTVSGKAEDRKAESYLHRGIATRSFERRFALADYVEVMGATMADGLLSIDLKRELPEALKPRRIEVGSGDIAQIGRKPPPRQVAA